MRKQFLQTEITNANAFISDCEIKREKYQKMRDSAPQFYRATAHLYYTDLSNGIIAVPDLWSSCSETFIWLSGDFHTQNIGFCDNQKGEVLFDLNDADESFLGPFYWDLLRFSTSLLLFTDELDFPYLMEQGENLIELFLQQYQHTMKCLKGNQGETHLEMSQKYVENGCIRRKLRKLQQTRKSEKFLEEWTTVVDSTRLFHPFHEKLKKVTDEERAAIMQNWNSYQQSLSRSFTKAREKDYFTIKDIARRVHEGLGSLGVDRYYILIEGGGTSKGKPVILEAKEQRCPSLFRADCTLQELDKKWFTNEAERSRIANKALMRHCDEHMGSVILGEKAFLVRRISPYKETLQKTDIQTSADMEDFVANAARALALAHARSDKDYCPKYISYSFERAYFHTIKACFSFQATIRDLAKRYYQQVKADHMAFQELFDAEVFFKSEERP